MVRNSRIVPDYAGAEKLERMLGDDFVVRDQICLEPLQALISDFMGAETFCYEWMDNRDEVLKLYAALTEMNRQVYSVVADGPLELSNYADSGCPHCGRENYARYFMPHYEEDAQICIRSTS
jgi:hypothetical protein